MTAGSLSERWLPLILLLVTLTFWSGLMVFVLRDARLDADSSGTVVAIFPRSTEPAAMFAGVVAAHGRLVRNTWFDNIWVVHSDQPGFVGRLQQQGLWAAYKPLPFGPIAIGGCIIAPLSLAAADRATPGTPSSTAAPAPAQ